MELSLLILMAISTITTLCFIGSSLWKLFSHYTTSSLITNIIISIIICVINIPELIISIMLDYDYYNSIVAIILWAFFAFVDIYTIKKRKKTSNIKQ